MLDRISYGGLLAIFIVNLNEMTQINIVMNEVDRSKRAIFLSGDTYLMTFLCPLEYSDPEKKHNVENTPNFIYNSVTPK